MFEKVFGRCPYCNYVWVLRVPDSQPKMCPLCKRRFGGGHNSPRWGGKPLKTWVEEFESYDQVRKRLKELAEKK